MRKFLQSPTFPMAKFFAGILLICIASIGNVKAQLTVNASTTAAQAVQNVLLGEGVTASNITFGGNQATQIGSFTCNNCGINLTSGVVMASGHVNGAVGPNNSGSFSLGPPNGNDNFGDPDLQAISGPTALHNAAILRFNFVPMGDSINFRFVFGSDEYPEYVGSINDVFGFFISGPGITGPYQNNARNIALIPGTTQPVSINSVNPTSNSTWYRPNNGQYNVQADGFTKVLTAKTAVVCGATYQIKIAIADASDGSWDSWVFLEADSFQATSVQIAYEAPDISPSSSGLYEGCQTANINFTRPPSAAANENQFALSYSGTAINGIDYELLPDTLIFPAGATSVSLPITAIADGVTEGNETVILTILNIGCNVGDPVSIEIMISDLPELAVDMPDVLINCGEEAFLEPQISGGLGNYSVSWTGTGLTQPSLSTYPSVPTSYPFTITDTCGITPLSGVANVVFVQNPPLLVDIGPDITAQCLDQININSVVSGGFGAYTYLWTANNLVVSAQENLSFMESTNQVIVLTVTDICSVSASDQLNLIYPPVPVTVEIGADITATCLDQNTVTPQVSGGIGNYSYTWTFGGNPAGFGQAVSVQTDVTKTLVLQVVDQCGNTSSDQLTVVIPPVNILLDIGPDVVATCLDNTPNTAITLENGIGNYSYLWTNNGTQVSNSPQYAVQTGETRTIGLTVTDQCGNTAQDQKQIIILPAPIALSVFPTPDTIICLGTWAKLGALATGGVGTLSYTWTGISGIPTNTQNSSIVQQSPSATSSYSVTVNDQCGNTNSAQMRVIVRELFPKFEPEFLNDTEIRVENLTEGNDPFLWTFGNGQTSTNDIETTNLLGASEWTATLTVFSPEGCSKSVTQDFTALGEVYIPNTFTPDHDGVNDFFFVVGHDLRYFELIIFNRYGETVFKSYDINEPWDGSYQGNAHFVPNGVYNYRLLAIGKRENTIERKGRITVFR